MRHEEKLINNCMIVSVDFDGTLCKHRFPDIGLPNIELITNLIDLKKNGNRIVLWTCREGKHLQEAVNWCKIYGLEFDAVNENVEHEFNKGAQKGRKVYSHIHIDDKAIHPDDFLTIIRRINDKKRKTWKKKI